MFPVLYSRSLLLIYCIYSSVCMLIPSSWFIPPHHVSSLVTTSLFLISASLFPFCKYVHFVSFLIRFHIWVISYDICLSLSALLQVFLTIYWIDCLFPTVCSCLLCCRLIDYISMGLSLSSLSCSIDLCVCVCVSTILFWLLSLCSVDCSQEAWYLQLLSSFSRCIGC